MSNIKPTPKPAQELRDDLTLDAETVADLEPRHRSGHVRGGRTGACGGASGMTGNS